MQHPLAARLLITGTLLALTACSGAGAAEPRDTAPPAAPTGLTATAGSATTVHVMWEAATDDRAVTGYQVLQDGRPVRELPATTLMADVTGLAPGTRHAFAVRARDAAGNLSPATPAVPATTPRATAEDREPPTAPRALRVTPEGPGAALLTWTASRDDTRVTAYDVHQGGVRVHTAPGTATTARLTGLRPGTAYSFTLRARDAAENSSPDSAPADLTTAPAPGAPPNTSPLALAAASDRGEITLTWTPPDTGAPVTHHELHIDGRFATTIAWGTTPPPGRATYTFPAQAEPGTTLTLTLRARLPDGTWGDFSAPRTVIVR
ncbi:fibronectin type III domain-containing protein [Streptomyces sp. NPDC035033]|uniref:fibronectin type III domain-containing protein n=1 Tax=Streptomyces sp. NPDC035033 TaxID=3155368 RepID=UPI0033E46542